jgi:hypothetical protein
VKEVSRRTIQEDSGSKLRSRDMDRGLRLTRSLFVWEICIDCCVFVCFWFWFSFCFCVYFYFYFYFLCFYISLLVFYIWELMRGKRDSARQAGVLTGGEGIREFVMATKWLNTI